MSLTRSLEEAIVDVSSVLVIMLSMSAAYPFQGDIGCSLFVSFIALVGLSLGLGLGGVSSLSPFYWLPFPLPCVSDEAASSDWLGGVFGLSL